MSDTGAITLQQMLRHPFVLKVVSRLQAQGNLFQQFYGLQVGARGTLRRPGRSVSWDIFDNTRTIAQVRAPASGPGTVRRKSTGVVTAQLVRLHEKLPITHDEIHLFRPLGSPIGTLDRSGQSYVARQIGYMTQRFRNAREFMVSRLFRGAFGITQAGDTHNLVESGGANDIQVDFQIPADHKGDINDLTTENGDWTAAGTKIIEQLLEINKISERETGLTQRHVWVNSTIIGQLLENTQLQGVGGSAFRVFDSLSGQQINTVEGPRQSGYTYVFRGLPQFVFHVYDGVANVNQEFDSQTVANSTLYIPDDKAIITPDPSPEWLGLAEGSEIVQENVHTQPNERFGFYSWNTPILDPGGREIKMVDNSLPILYVPKAVFYLTIDGQ